MGKFGRSARQEMIVRGKRSTQTLVRRRPAHRRGTQIDIRRAPPIDFVDSGILDPSKVTTATPFNLHQRTSADNHLAVRMSGPLSRIGPLDGAARRRPLSPTRPTAVPPGAA